jgi:anti-sigma factor RsiW
MDCRQYQEDFTAYMDGELAPARAGEIRLHVQRCSECAEELESLEYAAGFVQRSVAELEPDVRLWRTVKTRISLAREPEARPGLLQLLLGRRWATAAGALAAVLAITVGVWNYRQQQADEAELRQYMENYVHSREMQDRSPDRDQIRQYPDHMDNPFVTVRPVSYENPFRSEAR